MSRRVAGIVLAAGASRRMGSPKAALRLGGRTFLEHVVAALEGGGVEHVVVVAGSVPDAVRAALPPGRELPVLLNPAPEHGQLSSLKIALRHLQGALPAADAALLALVDHPAVQPATVAALLATAAADPAAAIVVPVHAGRRGHPVLFARALWAELLAADDALGARAVVRADPARVRLLPVEDPGVLIDVDTPADFRRLVHDPDDRR